MKLNLKEVVHEAYHQPFYLQSDFARANSLWVATAASLGYISCLTLDGLMTKQWRATEQGIKFYMEN